eukprot:CAMPEP_0173286258 /NCGR_PEP_ID=MMETSP1143-20121109/9084_1 /TAXON_ID=483371 /ORGANISM="non described non described, Strain CCMP2298" /LENGTH=60 /DNA_ID=CAMNT_0014224537 /DNA_START=569 /DNA_END=752 /DNA_ORIENTATION=+
MTLPKLGCAVHVLEQGQEKTDKPDVHTPNDLAKLGCAVHVLEQGQEKTDKPDVHTPNDLA